MKRLVTITLFLIFSESYAQNETKTNDVYESRPLQLGLKLGRVYNSFEGSEVEFQVDRKGAKIYGRKGIEVGAFTKIWMWKFLYTRLEVNYLQKGGSISGSSLRYPTILKTNYLNLPVLFGIILS